MGEGIYSISEYGNPTFEYRAWKGMLYRCYLDSTRDNYYPTYNNVTVCNEWHNFQNFAEWVSNTFPRHRHEVVFNLDKDLLQVGKQNKIYSPQTCVWLPERINKFLSTKYNTNTSGYIGVKVEKNTNKWVASSVDFLTRKNKTVGRFYTPEEASKAYLEFRAEQSEKAKDYLRSLNYLPEEIIQLIK